LKIRFEEILAKSAPRREKVTGGWRKLYNTEIFKRNIIYSKYIKEDEMGGTCNTHGRVGNPYEISEHRNI
jgi:hypothetical protein